ncbi:cell division protein FtsZ [Psittacicella hinzii]|uniref:Cell division protein FtsZ n=1 Tax=Psittacicella hinzii TaxID=2028575 RepID=A0A3A1YM95_9GAMM|nr:cell division protein FtsZ [Psittacicella hinzii]RIY38671.1 hypothetical protein CKF58_03700 [Psittacicella hinzii]
MTDPIGMENDFVLPVDNSNGGKPKMKQRDQLESIIVIGVGGAGNNAVDYLYKQEGYMENVGNSVKHYIFNTDENCLNNLQCENKLVLGRNTLKGKGAGANINVGQQATQESIDEIKEIVKGADLVFITAGMGGGTGTLGSSVVAELAKNEGAIVVSLVTLPFKYENRQRNAFSGIKHLYLYSDSLIMIDNQKIVDAYPDYEFTQGLDEANKILANAISGVIKIIRNPSTINTDFEDLRTVLNNGGKSQILYRSLEGEELEKITTEPDKTIDAIYEKVTTSPLITRSNIEQATAFLMLIECSSHFTQRIMDQFISRFTRHNGEEISNFDDLLDDLESLDDEKIEAIKNDGPQVIFAYNKLPDTEDNRPRLNVTIVATGMGTHAAKAKEAPQQAAPVYREPVQPSYQQASAAPQHNRQLDALTINPSSQARVLQQSYSAPATQTANVQSEADSAKTLNLDLFNTLSQEDQLKLLALLNAKVSQANVDQKGNEEYNGPRVPEDNPLFPNQAAKTETVTQSQAAATTLADTTPIKEQHTFRPSVSADDLSIDD